MNETKEFQFPNHAHWAAWLLLLIPPLNCCVIVSLVDFVPSGRYLALLQLALISVLPLGLSWGCAILIAQYLCRRWLGRIVICAGELVLIFLAWQLMVPLYMTSWR